MKILSVDDDGDSRYMLQTLLRGHGHEVESAGNGAAGLELARRGGFDLIVSDILMPQMDGFQFCREIKRDGRLRTIPFVFYTATYTDSKDRQFALSLGADRFLTKPLEPEELLSALEKAAARPPTAGAPPAPETPGENDTGYLKEYNSRLIAKLETKMLDLEHANRALQADIAERERVLAERSRLEGQLRQAQKMEAIGALAGGIAHDFNNILAGIIGFAELGRMEHRDAAACDANFAEILRASHRAKELVQQILTFSRHRGLPRQPLELSAALQESLRLMSAIVPAYVTIQTKVEPRLPTVLADGTQIHQLITNLVTNAWHAIGEHAGVIDVRLQSFTVDEDFAHSHPDLRPGRYVRLSISDTGHGMDRATADRVFEPFFTTKEPGRGTGLGLAVVHGIVKSCDGAIDLYSVPGQGSTFHVYFPALDLEAGPAAGEAAAVPTGHGERILFLDDEPVLGALGERLLRRLGYQPTIVSKPAEALAALEQKEFQLVITDLTMPLQNGLDFARRVWQERPELPVVLTTGYSATLDQPRVVELGFRDLLLKPYNLEALGACVHRALRGGAPAAPESADPVEEVSQPV